MVSSTSQLLKFGTNRFFSHSSIHSKITYSRHIEWSHQLENINIQSIMRKWIIIQLRKAKIGVILDKIMNDLRQFKGENSVQFSSVTQSCPILCSPMKRSMLGLPVHQQLLKFTQTHVHWVSDAIEPSHPLWSPSPPVFNLSEHQVLLKRVSYSHQVAKILTFQLQHQSFQWTPRTDIL